MFRTIKLKLPYHRAILETAIQFRDAVQIVLDYGFENKIFNKNTIKKTYRKVREELRLTSAPVQTARDTASESLKSTRLEKRIKRKSLTVGYDRRTFKFYPDSNTISITTVQGRLVFPISHTLIIDKYRGEYTNAELVIDKKNRIFVMVQVDVPEKEVINKDPEDIKIIGIDRGIKNIAILSNNKFFNSRHLREVKGRYQLKRELQHLGTRSAKRKLKKIAGRERRFVRDVNHVISKNIVSLPYDVIALEVLEPAKMKIDGKGKKFRRKLGSWSPAELEKFIEYKAEDAGMKVIYVYPNHTSQKCSRCGYVSKENRHGSVFRCKNCGFELNADLNASRTLKFSACLSTSGCSQPANRCGSMKLHSRVELETSSKLRSISEE